MRCEDAPCILACPAGVDIPNFIRRVSSGDFSGAARLIRENNPLGETCGLICPATQLCEGACLLTDIQHSGQDQPAGSVRMRVRAGIGRLARSVQRSETREGGGHRIGTRRNLLRVLPLHSRISSGSFRGGPGSGRAPGAGYDGPSAGPPTDSEGDTRGDGLRYRTPQQHHLRRRHQPGISLARRVRGRVHRNRPAGDARAGDRWRRPSGSHRRPGIPGRGPKTGQARANQKRSRPR